MADSLSPYSLASPDNRKRWLVIYPAYINAKKTQAQGRRISKSKQLKDKFCTVLVKTETTKCRKKGSNHAAKRKAPQPKAVDIPQVTEIRDVLSSKGFNAEIESKQYPREHSRDHALSGRVRVQLYNMDSSPVVPECQSRRDVLHLLCDLIPKLKSRHTRGAEGTSDSHQGSQSSNKKKKKHK